MLQRSIRQFLILAILVTCVSCGGSNHVAVYHTSGTVMFHGQPADGATVVFNPQGGDERFQAQRPYGRVESDGRFQLTTFVADDGAPAGDYVVTIEWQVSTNEEVESDRDVAEDPTDSPRMAPTADKLEGRYADSATSPLRATVTRGKNEIATFELK